MVLCVPDFSWFLILYVTICTFEWTVPSCKIYRFTLAEEFTSQLSLGFWTSVGSTVGVKPLPMLRGWRVGVCRRLRIVRLDCWLASLPKQDCSMHSVFPWVLWPCLLHSCLGYYAQQWMVLWINFPGTVGQQDLPQGWYSLLFRNLSLSRLYTEFPGQMGTLDFTLWRQEKPVYGLCALFKCHRKQDFYIASLCSG